VVKREIVGLANVLMGFAIAKPILSSFGKIITHFAKAFAGKTAYRVDAENQRIGINQTQYIYNSQPALSQVLVIL